MKRRKGFLVCDGYVLSASSVFEVGVFRTDTRIVEAGGDGMRR